MNTWPTAALVQTQTGEPGAAEGQLRQGLLILGYMWTQETTERCHGLWDVTSENHKQMCGRVSRVQGPCFH